MIIGFMRNAAQPNNLADLTATLCMNRGIELIYIHPSGVNMSDHTVEGQLFKHNTWVPVKTKLPPFIDIYPYCFNKKYKPVMDYLRENTILSYDKKNALNKSKLQKELSKDEQFAHLIIPTLKIENINDIETFVEEYPSVVIKPIYGEKGKGIYLLRRNKHSYLLSHYTEEKVCTKEELVHFYENTLKDKKYIIQKYIPSRTAQGDPFDCRIHVQKNGRGEWAIAKMFIRIGIGQKVMSNVNQGGGISDIKPFLKANFQENWELILDKLNHLGNTLPYKIEELKQTPIMTMGLDVGIDQGGDLYLFESNGSPITKPLLYESAMLRTDYYEYVIKTKLRPENDNTQLAEFAMETGNIAHEIQQLKENCKRLEREKRRYEKRCLSIENSRYWKLTKPARQVGSVLKKILRQSG